MGGVTEGRWQAVPLGLVHSTVLLSHNTTSFQPGLGKRISQQLEPFFVRRWECLLWAAKCP